MKKTFAYLRILFILAHSVTATAQLTKLLDFAGAVNGEKPLFTNLYSDTTFLYGMTSSGGMYNNGLVFKMKPDGSAYSDLLDLGFNLNGGVPDGSLISDGTFLYGMTSINGANNMGVIFKVKKDGSSYTKLFDFSGAADGEYPYGSLYYDGTFLYGMTSKGGANNIGVIFKIKPDGSSYTKLLDFGGAVNGSTPSGSLISDGTFLYGMTTDGGINNFGVVFKIKPDGSSYTKLLDFAGAANGQSPVTDLYYDGTFLYGMTKYGGANALGVVFKIKPDGSSYTKLFDFAGASNGSNPDGSLIFDGTFLYGIAGNGGANGFGVIFKIKTDGTSYTKLLDFAGSTNGQWPGGSLVYDGTFFYGMAWKGGANNMGVVFKLQDTVAVALGIADYSAKSEAGIYPNPNNGIFTIQDKALQNNENELEVFNMFGDKVYATKLNAFSSQVDMGNKADGIYLYRILTETGVLVSQGKFILRNK